MLSKIKSVLRKNGFKMFSRPYELNIIGVRSENTVANRFDDEIHVFYKVNGWQWNYHVYKATTDPSTFYLQNPMQVDGTAILAQGQYINAFEMGLHKGQYMALVQCKPVSIIRDYDRDAILDFANGNLAKGIFGINIHRAMAHGSATKVDRFSAGCQVFQNGEDFTDFMDLCARHRSFYGNKFTYSLIDMRAIERTKRLQLIVTGVATVLAGVGLWTLFEDG